jgi:hypothetical protein
MVVNIGEPILANIEKHIVDDIVTCPLRILNYPDVVAKLKPAISQWTGIKINQNLTRNPFTKQELIGTIPLGSCAQHVDCGNYTISKLFTSGKLLGNLQMYWAVIWYLVTQDTWEYLSEIKDQVTEHLIYRFKNSTTFASLSGLPQYVLTKVPTDVAIWYCANSCLLDPPTDRDTCRLHLFNMDVMLAILRVFSYPICTNTTKQINRTKVLMSMLSMSKKSNEQFRNKITCLVQNAIHIDVSQLPDQVKNLEGSIEWIPTDGPASEEQIKMILEKFPKYFSTLSVDELVGLSHMVDASKSGSDISLPCSMKFTPVTPVINWIYGLKNYNNEPVLICPYTFRPFYNVQYNGSIVTWKDRACELYGPLDKLFSARKKFIDFFYKYNSFPNFESYLLFCYNRYAKNFTVPTVPFDSPHWLIETLQSYSPIARIIKDKKMNEQDVLNVLNSSCSIVNRVQLESKYFENVENI